jgi:hypothetical protein
MEGLFGSNYIITLLGLINQIFELNAMSDLHECTLIILILAKSNARIGHKMMCINCTFV